MNKVWALLESIKAQGIPLPQAYDPVSKEASFRLLCAYISFVTAFVSVVCLHFFHVEIATFTSIGFFTLCMVFYMLKKLSKASVDLDKRSINLESDEK